MENGCAVGDRYAFFHCRRSDCCVIVVGASACGGAFRLASKTNRVVLPPFCLARKGNRLFWAPLVFIVTGVLIQKLLADRPYCLAMSKPKVFTLPECFGSSMTVVGWNELVLSGCFFLSVSFKYCVWWPSIKPRCLSEHHVCPPMLVKLWLNSVIQNRFGSVDEVIWSSHHVAAIFPIQPQRHTSVDGRCNSLCFIRMG